MSSQETSSGAGTRKTRAGLSKPTKAAISGVDDKDGDIIDSDGSTYDDGDHTESDDDFAGEISDEDDRSHGGHTRKKRKIESIRKRTGKLSSNLFMTPKKAEGNIANLILFTH